MPVIALVTQVQILDKLPAGGVLTPPASPALPAAYTSAGITTAYWQLTSMDVEDPDASLFAASAGGKFALTWSLVPAGSGGGGGGSMVVVSPGAITGIPEITVPTVTAAPIIVASTAVALETIIHAPVTNTGDVYVGGSDLTANNGVPMAPGVSRRFRVDNANRIYSLALISGQKLRAEVT